MLEKIDLNQIDHELFDVTAELIAEKLNEPLSQRGKKGINLNKSTQIRRFYEDIIAWDSQLNQLSSLEARKARFQEVLPLIKMLNAKVAYAYNRELVDEQFRDFIQCCIRQIKPDNLDGFKHFKLLFEAVIGFMKNKS